MAKRLGCVLNPADDLIQDSAGFAHCSFMGFQHKLGSKTLPKGAHSTFSVLADVYSIQCARQARVSMQRRPHEAKRGLNVEGSACMKLAVRHLWWQNPINKRS